MQCLPPEHGGKHDKLRSSGHTRGVFNMSLVKDMGNVIGRELRAYNAKVHNSLDMEPDHQYQSRREESPCVCVLYTFLSGMEYLFTWQLVAVQPRWSRNVDLPARYVTTL